MSEQPIFDIERADNTSIEERAFFGTPEVVRTVDRRPAKMRERQAEWDAENTIVHETLIHGDDSVTTRETTLAELRHELAEIPVQEGGDLPPPEVIEGLPQPDDTPQGILQEKKMLRLRKERKEAMKPFTEMLVVANDLQLLKEADQEAIGAFMKYVRANKDKITHFVANGDIADFSAQSVFEKDLNTLNSSNDEIEAVRWFIDEISALLPNAEKVFIDGNHEARWANLVKAEMGNEPWIKTLDEQFGLTEHGWKHIGYGSGEFYEWHERIFWHGHRTSIHTSKAELQDAGESVTTAHINRNQYFETTDARGVRKSGISHGGFSKDNLGFMKKAVTGWAQGFGVYFYDQRTKTETPYMITMSHRHPIFVGPDGNVYSGVGYQIPGFEQKRGRGRPRK